MISSSQRVRAEDFSQPWFHDRVTEMAHSTGAFNRKIWEWAFIAQVYHERIQLDRMALGFGCGREFIPAWLASRGAYVIASDLSLDAVTEDWTNTGQHASELDSLGWKGVCSEETLRNNVEFRAVDMNDIPEDLLQGEFDFVWSSSSLEHLGGLQAGADFLCKQMECLRPGGIAVHTTEFNFSSRDSTVDSHNLSLYRIDDLINIKRFLKSQGDLLWPFDLTPGDMEADRHVAVYPYNEPHLSLAIGEFMSTSIALVIEKGAA